MKNYRIFNKPYILIEDVKGKYQPFYKEYETIKQPFLNLEMRPMSCPFVENLKTRQIGKIKKTSKSGFCEVCYKRYSDYYEHVTEREHSEYAKEAINYQEVDDFIINFKNEEEFDLPSNEQYLDSIVSDVDSFMKEFLNK